MDKSFFECAKGLENNSKPNRECLFMMISSDGYPISVPVMSPGQLTAVIVDEQYTEQRVFCLETIQVFLDRRKVDVEKTINKIKKIHCER